jgi:glycosyltransferase involved in cell wall biosynthesis
MRLVGRGAGLRSRAAMRFPWLLQDASDVNFVRSYDVVLANSVYTQDWIKRLWSADSDVLFPPIDVAHIGCSPVRRPAILSGGRFFAPGLGHAKRQLEMVEFFGAAVRRGELDGWELVVVGGCEDSQLPYLEQVRSAARGLPVRIHANAPRPFVRELLAESSVFWSATGLGEDEDASPWSQEHFGMTTAEAMAGGCVPVVIDRAGQREIVRDGVDGFRWTTPEELIARTVQLSRDEELRARLSTSARERAQQFSDEAFAERWRAIAAQHRLLGD